MKSVLQRLIMLAADSMVVDPLTFAIWNEIGFLPIVEGLNTLKIEVVQSTLDTLKIRAADAQQAIKQKGGSLEAQGDKIALVEPSAAELRANAEMWSNLEIWVRNHTSVIPTEAVKDVPEVQISEILSSSAIDTIATASVSKKTFLSEDRRLRALAQSMGVTASAWTQPFIMALLQQGMITREKYVELLVNLQTRRVGFVSVGVDDLLVAGNSTRPGDFAAIVEALTTPNVDPLSAITIGVQFIREVWLNPKYTIIRDGLVSKIFYSLVAGRTDGLMIFRAIVKLTTDEIRSFPFPLDLIITPWANYVEKFLKGHFLMGVYLK